GYDASVGTLCTDDSHERHNAIRITLPLIQNAAHSDFCMDLQAKRAVTFRKPALGAPTPGRAQRDVTGSVESTQKLQRKRLLQRRNGKQEGCDAVSRARTLRKLAVLIRHMSASS